MGFVVKMTIMVFTCGCQHFSQMQTSFIGITNSVRKEKRRQVKIILPLYSAVRIFYFILCKRTSQNHSYRCLSNLNYIYIYHLSLCMHSYTFTSIYINKNTRAHKYKLIVVAYLGGDSFQIMTTTGHYISP
jgi:hypothetical protein